MTLAQVMIAMAAAGCSAEQMSAVASQHEQQRIQRRCERAVAKALFGDESPVSAAEVPQSPVSNVANPDSGLGAATASGGGPKAVARAALLMMPALRPAARRVGARLIEHCNLTTWRCDPSVRGMAMAEGLDERSVRRALGELEGLGLIRRTIHGSGRRNAYVIAWDALRGHAEAAENGATAKPDSARNRTHESGNPDKRVLRNLRRKPDQAGEGGTRREPDRRQRELRLLVPVKPPVSGDPIEAAIRGKYRGDERRISIMLGGWWALDDAQRDQFGNLRAFEAWLQQQGPPAGRRTG